MKKATLFVLIFLFLTTSCFSYDQNDNSYYLMEVSEIWNDGVVYDQGMVLASVQAIVNKQKPKLLFIDSYHRNQEFWINELKKPGEFLANKNEIKINSFNEFLNIFRDQIDGAVVWGEDCWACRNTAITAAGADGRKLIILRKDTNPNSVYSLLTKPSSLGGFGVPVVVDLTNRFTGSGTIWETGLPSTGSKKADAYKWALAKYVQTGKSNSQLAAYRLDGYWFYKTQILKSPDVGHVFDNDYLISEKAFVFDLSPWSDELPLDEPSQPLGMDTTTMRVIYEQLYLKSDKTKLIKTIGFPPFTAKYSTEAPAGINGTKGAHVAWQTEWKFAEIASNYNSFMEADIEGTYNTSFLKHIPQITYEQRRPWGDGNSVDWLKTKGYVLDNGMVADKKFVLLTSSDFDAVSWLQGFLIGNGKQVWLDQKRGQVPIAWAFNPQMVDRVPNIFNYVYKTKTANDFFVGGDSGAGYLNPSMLLPEKKIPGGSVTILSGVDPWVSHNKKYYQLLGYTITNNLLNGNAGAITQSSILNRLKEFSPDGVSALNGVAGEIRAVNNTPYIIESRVGKTGISPGYTAPQVAQVIKEEVVLRKFNQFRTVLIPPSTLVEAISIAKQTYPSLEPVDPYAFFELLKISSGIQITPVPTNIPTSTSIPCQKAKGDANCDGKINLTDFTLWLDVYKKLLADEVVVDQDRTKVDFNTDNDVNLTDFVIWRENYLKTLQ